MDNVITTGDLGIFNVYVKAAADVFEWTDAGAANPNYASTPYNPSIQVNTVVWDEDVQKYVAFYKSTAWSGVAYYLDVVVVLNGAGTTATEIYLGRRSVKVGRDYGAVVAAQSSVSGKGLEGGIAGASLQVTVTLANADGRAATQPDPFCH